MFAGVGSQAMALRNIGADFEHYRVVEFDKYAIASYNAIHDTDFPTMDITKVKGEELGIVDTGQYTYIMTYSFPCQDLSLAGKGKGMKRGSGTRSGLLWEVERLLKETEHLPQVLLMENVPEVIGQKNIQDFRQWQYFLEELGYMNYTQTLNAKHYGVAQNRNRTFMVSILGEYNYRFPSKVKLEKTIADYLEEEVEDKFYIKGEKLEMLHKQLIVDKKRDEDIVTCDYRYDEGLRPRKENISPTLTTKSASSSLSAVPMIAIKKVGNVSPNNHGGGNVFSSEGISPTLLSRDYKDPIKIRQATKKGYIECKPGGVADLSYPTSELRRGRVQGGGDISPTLTTNPTLYKFDNQYDFRVLTSKEYWRLMGFTDEDFHKAEKVVSNSQLYKQAGNSIVVPVLEGIFKGMMG